MLRLITLLAAVTGTAATAQQTVSTETPLDPPVFSSQGSGPAIAFTLRGGVQTEPSYFGSNSNDLNPDVGFDLHYLRLGGFTFGNPDPNFIREGFSIRPSFRFIDDRDEGDGSELEGLDDIDTSFELGLGVAYTTRNWEVFGNARYGVVGHDDFVGEIGADLFARPNGRLLLRGGPRLFFGDDGYASEYFGVTSGEAAVSDFSAFSADGGLLSAGVEVGATYQFNDRWGIDAAVRYERLTGDAEDSPISIDDDQITARIGITRRFTLGF